MKFYNPGDKTFETDFSLSVGLCVWRHSEKKLVTGFLRFSTPGHLSTLEVFRAALNRAGAPTRAGALTKSREYDVIFMFKIEHSWKKC